MAELVRIIGWVIHIVGDISAGAIILAVPFAFFPRTRLLSALVFVYGSFAIGASYWFDCLTITYGAFGLIGTIVGIGMAGVGVVIAALGHFLVRGEWLSFGAFLGGGLLILVIQIIGWFLLSEEMEMKQVDTEVDRRRKAQEKRGRDFQRALVKGVRTRPEVY